MISKLFPEILEYIMILAQESSPILADAGDLDSGSMRVVPLSPFEITISHVNSHLRGVALHTSCLWSCIRVDTGAQDVSLALERTEAYISRSGGHLLDMRVELRQITCEYGEPWMLERLIGMVAEASRRWRRLTVMSEWEGTTGADALIARLSRDEEAEGLVPELEYLSISVDCTWDDHGVWPRSRPLRDNENAGPHSTARFHKATFLSFAKLTFLRLRGLAIYLFRLTLLPALQTLHLDQTKAIPMTSKIFGNFVTACPALEHLSVFGDIVKSSIGNGGSVGLQVPIPVLGGGHAQHHYHQNGSGSSSGTGGIRTGRPSAKQREGIISLPELRSLRICGTQGVVYDTLLSHLEAPKLRSLVLKDAQEHDLDTLGVPLPFSPVLGVNSNDSGSGGADNASGTCAMTLMSKFTQMQSLIISNSDLSNSVYGRLFKIFPFITEFASYSSLDVDVASKLLVGGAVGVPWPDLHTLTFIFDVDLCVDDMALAEMLKRRRRFGFPLNKVRIGVTELDEDHVLEAVVHDTVIVVEKLDEFDVWPTDRQYPDIDDILF